MMDINKLRSLALDGDLAAMQAIVIHLERVEKERDDLRAAMLCMERTPYEIIGKILTEVMNIAVANGADSRSMPDEYVEVAAWLCGIPSAQPTPTALVGARKVTRDFRWDSTTQCHVPTLKVEFEPVHVGAPNDAKGWQDRDRIAAMLEAAPSTQPTSIIPEGWKLVPIEPTETMINEGSCASSRHGPHYISEECARQCWKYMIATTPEVKP